MPPLHGRCMSAQTIVVFGVQLDGHDVREYNVAALRKQFGVVNQEPCLFAARHVIMWMHVLN